MSVLHDDEKMPAPLQPKGRDGPYEGPFQVRHPLIHKDDPKNPLGLDENERNETWLEDTRDHRAVWVDGHEPEDMCLGRDLDDFVHALNAEATFAKLLQERLIEARGLVSSTAQGMATIEAIRMAREAQNAVKNLRADLAVAIEERDEARRSDEANEKMAADNGHYYMIAAGERDAAKEELATEKAARERAEAACAEMRKALSGLIRDSNHVFTCAAVMTKRGTLRTGVGKGGRCDCGWSESSEGAIRVLTRLDAGQAGAGWLSPEEAGRLRADRDQLLKDAKRLSEGYREVKAEVGRLTKEMAAVLCVCGHAKEQHYAAGDCSACACKYFRTAAGAEVAAARREAEHWQAVKLAPPSAPLVEQMNKTVNERDDARAEVERLRGALEFYADPASYFAIAVRGDSPCGEFIEDFSECVNEHGFEVVKPGKRARAALAGEKPKS